MIDCGQVKLYEWPDGTAVYREIERFEAPYVLFVMEEPSGQRSKHRIEVYKDLVPTESYHLIGNPYEQLGPGWAEREKWLAFAMDMVMLPSQTISGRWGFIRLPLWLKSSVFERADDLARETMIHDIGKDLYALEDEYFKMEKRDSPSWILQAQDYRMDAARTKLDDLVNDFVRDVFEGYQVEIDETNNSQIVSILNSHGQVISAFLVAYKVTPGGIQWQIFDEEDRFIAVDGRGPTLKETLRTVRLNQCGPITDEKHERAYFEEVPEYGTPTVEFDPEVYDLLEVASPVIWPQSEFLAWYKTAVGAP